MADNDYNIIKPVESMKNVGDITPAKRREERKKRQNSREQKDRQRQLAGDSLNQSIEENINSEIAEEDQNEHSIDYCA
jgi:hypothetical protein